MTTPSLHTTFDASLIDLYRSFSSTETASSNGKENLPPTMPVPRTVRNSTTERLYEEWADTYDNDGNFLQSVDDLKITETLPELADLVPKHANQPLRILDLGCGTGRTTLKLLQYPWNRPIVIEAFDASKAMLDIAQTKFKDTNVTFRQIDIAASDWWPNCIGRFDLVVSTLVLEHIELADFFVAVGRLLSPDGVAFVSNMHPDMGHKSVAGFADEQGRRVTGRSFVHGVQETVAAAERSAGRVLRTHEVAVDQRMLDNGSVGERGRKWLGTKVWYGVCVKKCWR